MKRMQNSFSCKRKSKVRQIVATAVCILVAVTAPVAGFQIVKNKNAVRFSAGEYWFLTFYRGKNALSAKEAASSLLFRGGAGYIEKGDTVAVFGCVYGDKAEADRAAEGILASGTNVWTEKRTASIYLPKGSETLAALEVLLAGVKDAFLSARKLYRAMDEGTSAALIWSQAEAAAERALAAAKEVAARLTMLPSARKTRGRIAKNEQKGRFSLREGAALLTECAARFRTVTSENAGERFGTENAVAVRRAMIELTLSYLALFS